MTGAGVELGAGGLCINELCRTMNYMPKNHGDGAVLKNVIYVTGWVSRGGEAIAFSRPVVQFFPYMSR